MMFESVDGTSQFTPERLARRMDAVEAELSVLKNDIDTLQNEMSESEKLLEKIRVEHKQLVSWASVFSNADIETQKMIASYIIKKVSINANDDIDVELNVDDEQYTMGMSL